MTGEILVTNVVPGDGATVIVCDVTIGRIAIHGVSLRSGARGSFVNLPRSWSGGRWRSAVEILDHDLLDAVRSAVVVAAAEAVRFV